MNDDQFDEFDDRSPSFESDKADRSVYYATRSNEPVADIIVMPLRGVPNAHRLVLTPEFAPVLGETPTPPDEGDPYQQAHILVTYSIDRHLMHKGFLQPNPNTCELCGDRHYITVQVDLNKVCDQYDTCDHTDPATEHFEQPTHQLACPACRTGDYLLTMTESRWHS
jgi:hypothetical protein